MHQDFRAPSGVGQVEDAAKRRMCNIQFIEVHLLLTILRSKQVHEAGYLIYTLRYLHFLVSQCLCIMIRQSVANHCTPPLPDNVEVSMLYLKCLTGSTISSSPDAVLWATVLRFEISPSPEASTGQPVLPLQANRPHRYCASRKSPSHRTSSATSLRLCVGAS